jgi:hypothetical protein
VLAIWIEGIGKALLDQIGHPAQIPAHIEGAKLPIR